MTLERRLQILEEAVRVVQLREAAQRTVELVGGSCTVDEAAAAVTEASAALAEARRQRPDAAWPELAPLAATIMGLDEATIASNLRFIIGEEEGA